MSISYKTDKELLASTTLDADIASDAFALIGFSRVGVIFT